MAKYTQKTSLRRESRIQSLAFLFGKRFTQTQAYPHLKVAYGVARFLVGVALGLYIIWAVFSGGPGPAKLPDGSFLNDW